MKKKRAANGKAQPQKDVLDGRRVAFFGRFNLWPAYHGGSPMDVAKAFGATVTKDVDDTLDILVLGDKRGTGRSEAKKKAAALHRKRQRKSGELDVPPLIMNEATFRELVRRDISDSKFTFCGGFDCAPPEMDDLLHGMVTHAGGQVHANVDEQLNYLVVGNRRGKGKTAALRKATELKANGVGIILLDESAFLELVHRETSASANDQLSFAGFFGNLHGIANEKKIQRAMKMLKQETFQLYANNSDSRVAGVVRSQTGSDTVYAPWIESNGRYGCSTIDLSDCMGLQGDVCKHLLVLLLGLVRTDVIDARTTMDWLTKANRKRPSKEGEHAVEAFLQYKGVVAGEIDWRPTETVPEDFFAF